MKSIIAAAATVVLFLIWAIYKFAMLFKDTENDYRESMGYYSKVGDETSTSGKVPGTGKNDDSRKDSSSDGS